MGVEETGTPGTVREVLIPELEETTVGGLAGGWVALKKTVEMTVIVTGSSASGCVGCGVPSVDRSLIEETEWEGEPVGREPMGGVEDGPPDEVGRDRTVEVVEGFTEDPPKALESVTLSPPKLASLRARPEWPSPTTSRAHKVPEHGFLATKGAVITRPADATRAKIINDLKDMLKCSFKDFRNAGGE